MYEALGRAVVRFGWAYARRRYRRQLRLGAGILVAAALGIAAYAASRDAPEG